MPKAIITTFFILSGMYGWSQSFIDSAIVKWNDKNLVVLQAQAHDLTDQVYKRIIQRSAKNPKMLLDEIAAKSVEKAAEFGTEGQIIIYANLGEAFFYHNDVTKGLYYMTEARKKAVGFSGLPRAYLYFKYAEVFQDLNRLDSAILYSERVLDIAYALKNDSLERLALEKIAFQCYRSANFKRSKFYFEKILTNRSSNLIQQMNALNTIGLIFRNLKNYDSARNYYYKSLNIAHTLRDTAWIGLLNGNIGHSYYLEKKYELAVAGLEKDYDFSRRANNVESSIYALSSLLNVHVQLGNISKAKIYFDSLKRIIPLTSDRQTRSDYLLNMANYYEKIGNKDKTIQYLRLHVNLQDSLRILRNGERTAELEAQFNFDRYTQKIHDLESMAALQSERNIRNRIIIVSFILLTLVGSTTTLLLYKNYKLKKKTNQVLEEKNLEITAQKETLQQLNETKNKLFSIIGHDLRGPINSLKGLLALATSNVLSREEFLKMTTQLQHSVEQVHFTLNNLLHWAKSQMQGIKPEVRAIDLRDLVHENIQFLQQTATSKGIELKNNVTNSCWVLADADLVRLVIRNVLGNAIKFTPAGGMVSLHSEITTAKNILSIVDTGIGMSKDVAQKLLKNEFAKSQSGTGGEKGTGLGLLLSKEMIEKIGGTIWIESEPGQGTTVKIALPASLKAGS